MLFGGSDLNGAQRSLYRYAATSKAVYLACAGVNVRKSPVVLKHGATEILAFYSFVTGGQGKRYYLLRKAHKHTNDVYQVTAQIESHSALERVQPAALIPVVAHAHLSLDRKNIAQLAAFFQLHRLIDHRIEAVNVAQSERQLLAFDDIKQLFVLGNVTAARLIQKHRNTALGKPLRVIHLAVLARLDYYRVGAGRAKQFVYCKTPFALVELFVLAGDKIAYAHHLENFRVLFHRFEIGCGMVVSVAHHYYLNSFHTLLLYSVPIKLNEWETLFF